jgi:hypothetical protein
MMQPVLPPKTSTSSVVASQSLSIPSQISTTAGEIAAFPSHATGST